MVFLFNYFVMKQLFLIISLLVSISVNSKSYRELSFEELNASAKNDDVVAMGFLAENYEKGHGVEADLDKALMWYKKAAEQNYAPAQYNFAVLLGQDVSLQQDLPQSFFWAEKAAEQNNILAQFLVASYYAQGRGVYENKHKAFTWYLRAAKQDHSKAQYNLALMLLQGDGIEKDYDQGMDWLNKAAKQNNAQAISVLNLIKNN